MTRSEKDYVTSIIYNEGFGYTFEDYSDFDEIKDEKFHQIRKEYIEAAEKLRNYIALNDE